MRLHSRFFLVILVILLGLEGAIAVSLYRSARDNVETQTEERLQIAQRTFNDALENQRRFLTSSVETVGKDWALRQAVGQQDTETLVSVLGNHSRRIEADIALFIDTQGAVIASTQGRADALSKQVRAALMQASSDTLYQLAALNGRYYQLVLTQVHAPVRFGWVGMGFAIDDALASNFGQLTGLDISFVETGVGAHRFVASTLTADKRQSLMQGWTFNPGASVERMTGNNWEDLLLYSPLSGSAGDGFGVLLQGSLDVPLARFQAWWLELLLIFTAVTLIALVLAYFTSRGVTRPVQRLAEAVKDVARGDYSSSLDIDRRDEIGDLAKTFSHMQGAIQVRENEIRYRAEHNLVTGLYNRNGLLNCIENLITQHHHDHHSIMVAVLEINHFQEITDTLGHHCGDKLLKQVTERLAEGFQGSHLGHIDTQTFALATPIAQASAIYNANETIQTCFNEVFGLENISLNLAVHLGVSVYPQDAGDPESLLRLAHVALDQGKKQRKPLMLYDHQFDQHSVRRLALMNELLHAINNHQLELHYQPKLKLEHRQAVVSGVECLVRWQHPELGFVPPDEFIPLAEKTGYITELTQWVLDQALSRCSYWRKRKLNIQTAVNISAIDLLREDFVECIAGLLARHHVPAASLTLEVTESAAMRDPERAIEQLRQLSELGVRLSIDDYGTGFSSLAQLKKLPVHEIKIDKSFVLDLNNNQEDATIVLSTIKLGHSMGLQVVAEGVEDRESLQQLAEWQCDYAQGFHISRPLQSEDLELWLDQAHYPLPKIAQSVINKAATQSKQA